MKTNPPSGEPARPVREEERWRVRRGRVRGAPRAVRLQLRQEVRPLRIRHRQRNLLARKSLHITAVLSESWAKLRAKL